METPSWFKEEKIKVTLDARPLLASGQHPLERVMSESALLNKDEIYEILTPFPPAPMIDKMGASGFDTFSEQDASGIFHTYFRKQ